MKRLTDLPQNIQDALRVAGSASGLECPECEGGDSRERSLSVARDGGYVMYRCWRDKCGWRGKAIINTDDAAEVPVPTFTPRQFTQPTWKLSNIEASLLYAKYNLQRGTLDDCGVRSVGDCMSFSLYMPVKGPYGTLRGSVIRSMDGNGPKARSFKTADEIWQSWYMPSGYDWDDESVIIVEDQLSAMRLYQLGYPSVALLGTSLTPDKLGEIKADGPALADFAVLALDNDAYHTALKYAREYAGRFPLVPVYLTKDIKDCTNAEILNLLEVVDS